MELLLWTPSGLLENQRLLKSSDPHPDFPYISLPNLPVFGACGVLQPGCGKSSCQAWALDDPMAEMLKVCRDADDQPLDFQPQSWVHDEQ